MCDFCCGKYKKIKNGFNEEEIYLDENDNLCFDNSGHEYGLEIIEHTPYINQNRPKELRHG